MEGVFEPLRGLLYAEFFGISVWIYLAGLVLWLLLMRLFLSKSSSSAPRARRGLGLGVALGRSKTPSATRPSRKISGPPPSSVAELPSAFRIGPGAPPSAPTVSSSPRPRVEGIGAASEMPRLPRMVPPPVATPSPAQVAPPQRVEGVGAAEEMLGLRVDTAPITARPSPVPPAPAPASPAPALAASAFRLHAAAASDNGPAFPVMPALTPINPSPASTPAEAPPIPSSVPDKMPVGGASAKVAGLEMPTADSLMAASVPVDDAKRVADLSARWALDQTRDGTHATPQANETPAKAIIGPGEAGRKFAAASKRLDTVECSVFAPAAPRSASRILIQALLHKTEQLARAIEMAHQLTPDANRKGFAKLKTRIRRGAEVSLFLDMPIFDIAKPLVKVVWDGEAVRAVYSAVIPADTPLGAASGTLHVMIDGAPVGEIAFTLRIGEAVAARTNVSGQAPVYGALDASPMVVADGSGNAVVPIATDAKTFTRAFVSYSRKDFDEVSRYVEILDDCGIHTLFDLTSLEPGVEWEQELPRMIEAADVFYLMWSENAAQSPVVDMEARQAVSLHDANPERVPRVRPVLLRTPSPLPHDYLKRFNFSADWALRRAGYKAGVIFTPAEPAKN